MAESASGDCGDDWRGEMTVMERDEYLARGP